MEEIIFLKQSSTMDTQILQFMKILVKVKQNTFYTSTKKSTILKTQMFVLLKPQNNHLKNFFQEKHQNFQELPQLSLNNNFMFNITTLIMKKEITFFNFSSKPIVENNR